MSDSPHRVVAAGADGASEYSQEELDYLVELFDAWYAFHPGEPIPPPEDR